MNSDAFVLKGRELLANSSISIDDIIDDVLDSYAHGSYDRHPDEWVKQLEPIDLSNDATTNIARVEYVGEDETFDIEVEHPDHQYVLSSGILSSNSHAIAYAIDSYLCAFLLTHHTEEWLCAFLEANSSNPDDRAAAFSQVKRMGYEVVGIDVNEATKSWTILSGKRFMPSFLSCKGIGPGAADEIIALRPFASVETMLFDDDGSWRPSKFNKRGMEALIKVGGMKSFDCVGEGRLFSSWRHMNHVVIDRQDELKRTSKKDPHRGLKTLYDIARETRDEFADEWSRKELVTFQVEYFGSVDVQALVGPELIQKLAEKGIPSVGELEVGEKRIAWFVPQGVTMKKTKKKQPYGEIEALSPSGRTVRLKVWGMGDPSVVEPFSTCFAEVSRDEWGCSTQIWRLKRLDS